MSFGTKLKELRKEKKLTQKELAEGAGLRQSHISAWENETRQPLPDGLIKIADYFSCSIDYLLERELILSNSNVLENLEDSEEIIEL